MKDKNRSIGIFDSGVGGLTVLKDLIKTLNHESYIYVGDYKYMPYGNKTIKELLFISRRIISYFISQNVKLIIIACNTISSTVFKVLKDEYKKYDVLIVDVIIPTVKMIRKFNPKRLLVIATENTINTHIYSKYINKYYKNIEVFELSTPSFVPNIENNSQNLEDIVYKTLKNYQNFDTILLGCTHYELLREIITKHFNFNIISSSKCLDKYIYNILRKRDLLGTCFSVKILTTKAKNKFYSISKDIIDKEVGMIDI